MRIRSNPSASNAGRWIKITANATAKNMEKLSSGYQINRAADDAAGLAISEKMRKQIRGLTRASMNCEDGISLVQTAEGALSEIHDMLQRMNELSIQSANGTNSDSDRADLHKEFAQLLTEINRVSKTTTFNGMRIFPDGIEEVETTTAVDDKGTGVVCGDFTVYGGTEGVDFSYDASSKMLTVLSDTTLTIEGTGEATTDRIAVASGVNAVLTLSNVNIDVSGTIGRCAFLVNENATLTLTLEGENTLVSGMNCAGLQLNESASLVITSDSTGSLDATGGRNGAGIGSGSSGSCGTIVINGGTLTATGGDWGAGIGSGNKGNCEDICINGGNIIATGGYIGAGIGGGSEGSCGNITISGGSITATGGAAGIGSGCTGSCENITISGGDVIAEGDAGAGIGSATFGECGNISISGGNVTATGGTWGAGIGSGYGGSCGDINISGGNVTATSSSSDADDIGSGWRGTCGTVTIGGDGSSASGSVTTATTQTIVSYISQAPTTRWWIQTGVDGKVGMEIVIGAIDTKALNLNGANVRTEEDCDSAIDLIAAAIKKISEQRTRLGSYQNRLEHTVRNLENVVENTTAAESRIRDTDMAEEMVAYSTHNILLQAGQSMLAQANQSNDGVLTLLSAR